MAKLIVILLMALFLEAVGVVFLSRGLKQIGELQQISFPEVARLARRGITNHYIVFGVIMEALFFLLLLVMLKGWDVSLVWPLTSLGFVLTTVAARFIGHEEVSRLRWSGVLLIVIGATLVGYSEKLRNDRPSRMAGSDLSRE
jgi:drug/metabolite transporter (DMT)-like permease